MFFAIVCVCGRFWQIRSQIQDDDELLNSYTEFPTVLHLLACFQFIGPAVAVLSYDSSKVIQDAANACVLGYPHILSLLNEFLTLCCLKLGSPKQDLHSFSVSGVATNCLQILGLISCMFNSKKFPFGHVKTLLMNISLLFSNHHIPGQDV